MGSCPSWTNHLNLWERRGLFEVKHSHQYVNKISSASQRDVKRAEQVENLHPRNGSF